MRLVSIVSLCAFLFLSLALGQAALTFWSLDKTRFHTERIDLAHQSYERHLNLASHTYQLFKQYGDAMLIGDRDLGAGEAELTALIREDIRAIRRLIGQEIELVGEEEVEELEALAKIENKIENLIDQFERAVGAERADGIAPYWSDLSRVLDDDIDKDFRSLMTLALEEEQEEVAETRALLSSEMSRIRRLGILIALIAMLATAVVGYAYWRGVHARLVALMGGVSRMQQGVLDQPIRVRGQDEIGNVAGLLNEMATDVHRQRESLESRNSVLEEAVASRTVELERLLEQARQAESNRRRLLSDVSHELKTPLTIIKGESEVALRGNSTEEDYREALQRTRDAASHTAGLIDDLLLISRKEEGQLRMRTETTDLVRFINDSVALSPVPVTLDIRLDKASAEVDRMRLRQSLLALLNNAKVHGGQTVTASLTERQSHFRIGIADDGPGLPDTEKELVFQRFFRGSNAAGNYREGSGLGLPIVRAIAEAHGGTAGVEDGETGGSVFFIDLPKSAGLRAVS